MLFSIPEEGDPGVCGDIMELASGRDGTWMSCMDNLPDECLIYSIGAGSGAVERYLGRERWGCEVHCIDKTLDKTSAAYIDLFTYDTHLHLLGYNEMESQRALNEHADVKINLLKVDCVECVYAENVFHPDLLKGVDQLLLELVLDHKRRRDGRNSKDELALQLLSMLKAEGFKAFYRSDSFEHGDWHRKREGGIKVGVRQKLGFVRDRNDDSGQRPFTEAMALHRRSLDEPVRPPIVPMDPIKMHKADLKLGRVVASFTTVPSHINALGMAINALKAQSYHLDTIYVNIPKFSPRTNRTSKVPKELLEDPDIIVNLMERDLGPASKLLPTLLKETDPSTLIVVIDDDFAPLKDFVLNLVNAAYRYPQFAIGHTGWNVSCLLDFPCAKYGNQNLEWGNYMFVRPASDDSCHTQFLETYGPHHCVDMASSIDDVRPVDLIEGYRGAIYRRVFFNTQTIIGNLEKLLDGHYEDAPEGLVWVDDVWISGNLAERGVARAITPEYEKGFPKELQLVQPRKKNGKGVTFRKRYEATIGSGDRDLVKDALHDTVQLFHDFNKDGAKFFRSRRAW